MSELPPDDPLAPEDEGAPSPATVIAAELALNLLEGEAQAAAEARAAVDPDFATEAATWSTRLSPLVEGVAPVEAPPTLWPRIVRAAGFPAEAPAVMLSAATVPAPAPQPTAAPSNVTPFPARALALWRAGALGAGAVAAASLVAVVVLAQRHAPAAGPLFAAQLDPPPSATRLDVEPLFTATLDPARRAVVMAPVAPGPVDGRARELWLIPADGKPRAVAVIDPRSTAPARLTPDLVALVASGATLAVSLEPKGGSPTGLPTGPVIASGKLARI